MNHHQKLLDFANKLGFNFGNEGFCHAISIRWLEAVILGEEQVFHDRVMKIITEDEELLTALKNLNTKSKPLSSDDLELIQIRAFFESTFIYQKSYNLQSLFHTATSPNQADIKLASTLAASKEILSRGGLESVYTEAMILEQNEIMAYLDELGHFIEQLDNAPQEPIGITFTNYEHVIALTYQANKGWKLMDINQYPSTAHPISDTAAMAEKIVLGFKSHPSSPYIGFNARVVTTGTNNQNDVLTNQFKSFKNKHVLTAEIACREEQINLAYLAADIGDTALLQKLGEYNKSIDDELSTQAPEALCNRKQNTVNFNFQSPKGNSPACIAAQHGYPDVIKELALQGADLDQPNTCGATPAYFAAKHGHSEVIEVLASLGADLNRPTNDKTTPAYVAADSNHAKVIKQLASHGADLDQPGISGTTPVYIAAQNGHVNVVKELLLYDVDLNKASNKGITPLIIAAQMGHLDVIKELLLNKADLNTTDNSGTTAAYIAAQNGHLDVIRELARNKADFSIPDSIGATPAIIAAYMGHADIIRVLVTHLNKVDLNRPANNGATPVGVAAQNGFAKVIRELAQNGADVSIKCGDYTPAYLAAKSGHVEAIQALALHGADFNQSCSDGATPAYIAAQKGHANVIKELALHKVDFNQPYAKYTTPVFIAAQKGHTEALKALIKAGADISIPFVSTPESLMSFALKKNVLTRMTDFITQYQSTAVDPEIIKMTPYDIAVVMNHKDIMSTLTAKITTSTKSSMLSDAHSLFSKNTPGILANIQSNQDERSQENPIPFVSCTNT